jgi:Txe/YoeB family toxin of Txe-Axe toxin-antitoxin module
MSVSAVILFAVATPASTQTIEPAVGGGIFEKMQSTFAQAYSRRKAME